MHYRWLGVSLCVVLLAGLAVGWAGPEPVAAQSYGTVNVRLWQGEAPRPGRTVIGPATGVTLTYFWYAATEAHVQEFISHAVLDITLDGTPLFVSPEAVTMWWQDPEPFTLGDQSVHRAWWVFTLDALPAGVHTFKTVISLNAAVSDGISLASFGPGVLKETTHMVMVVDGGFALPVGVAVPVGAPPAAQPTAALPTPVYVAPTAAPAYVTAVPAYVTAVPAVVPTPVPVVQYVPPAAPPEQWISREESYGGRVVGTLLAEAQAYWYPAEGNLVQPSTVFYAGQTLWVYGMDPTRQFYMVIIDEAYVWIRASTIGPTNDAVWQGRALPTVIINPN